MFCWDLLWLLSSGNIALLMWLSFLYSASSLEQLRLLYRVQGEFSPGLSDLEQGICPYVHLVQVLWHTSAQVSAEGSYDLFHSTPSA